MRRGQKGQALVEFSLIFTFIFLPMLFGLIEGARLIYTNNLLSNAAREGARLGSVQAGWLGQSGNGCNTANGPVCPTQAALATNILAAANGEMIGAVQLSTQSGDPDHYVAVTCNGAAPSQAACATGGTVKVTVTYRYVPFLPIMSSGSVQLKASASMAIQ